MLCMQQRCTSLAGRRPARAVPSASVHAAGQAICMCASLAKYPEARACVRTELKKELQEPLTFTSIQQLPFTFAFMKETLRCTLSP